MKFSLKSKFIPKDNKYLTNLLPRLETEKVRSYTTLVLTLIVLSFFGIFAIGPTLSTIADLQKQIDDNSFVNHALEQKISNLTTLQQSYSGLQNDLPVVMDAVPNNPSLSSFVGQIESVGEQSGVNVNRSQIFPVDLSGTTITPYQSVAFSIEAEGKYSQVLNYLTNLANFSRIITFDNVYINAIGRTGDSFLINIRGKMYFKTE